MTEMVSVKIIVARKGKWWFKMGILDAIKAPVQAPQVYTQPKQASAPSNIDYGRVNAVQDSTKLPPINASEGTHVVEVIMCRDGRMPNHTKMANKQYYAVDFKVLESTVYRPGEERGWITVDHGFDKMLQDIRRFFRPLCEGTGADPAQLSNALGVPLLPDGTLNLGAIAGRAVQEDNPVQGLRIMISTVRGNKVNPTTGLPYLNTNFQAIPKVA